MATTPITALEFIALRCQKYAGDLRVPSLIVLAENYIGSKIPTGNPLQIALGLQVLHWLILDDRFNEGSEAVGAVGAEREGELEVKYINPNAGVMHFTSDMKGYYSQTTYGLELFHHLKKYIITVVTRFS